MKKIPKHIILNHEIQPPVFQCTICGITRAVHLPAAVDDFLKQIEAFAESHKYCGKDKPHNIPVSGRNAF
jgi:hypothetical protein